jgi:hypothetical protein
MGETVEIHDDHFLPDAKDEDWLLEAGRRSWIVLTKDDRIRYRVTERTTIASAKVRAFVLTSTRLQGLEWPPRLLKRFHASGDLSPATRLHSLHGFQEREKFRRCEPSEQTILTRGQFRFFVPRMAGPA